VRCSGFRGLLWLVWLLCFLSSVTRAGRRLVVAGLEG